MSFSACGSLHHGLDPERRFSHESRGRREIFVCLAALFADSRWGCEDIDQILVQGDSFSLCIHVSGKLPTLAF